jgi:CheY-like chemotaxis protein
VHPILDSAEFHELVHELGNLIAGIRWNADALLAGAAVRADRAEVEQIRQAAERAAELILRLATGAGSDAAQPAQPAAANPGLHPAGATVLLVEDSDMLRPVMRRALEAGGFRVLEATGPDLALELTRRHRDELALVIADLVIPGASGARIAQEVRALCPGAAVLLTSGALPGASARGSDGGTARFLAKPFTLEQLLAAARDALAVAPSPASRV